MSAVGDPAPDFTLKDQNNQPVTLSGFRGARNVLLVFFPLAFTGICQRELDEIQQRIDDFDNADTATLAISVGPSPTHKVWAAQRGFTFPVLSDFWPHGEVSKAYGVFNEDSGFANRGTFAVDRAGVIRFADCRAPGEGRDQSVWSAALAAVASPAG
ncbi:peroxiredoxin [Mycobacterium sp. Y57]|uniref:peroxiredoxin n=1 Tax=Mycolicibacterium xanthum TaxID=2796469 RepID=UPI001C84ECC1|nr:peroxiredoxin [Mycolicibacterium xanthum]MBX7431585.1 peroxiredoxin [Mycolicibacterium xanthum]